MGNAADELPFVIIFPEDDSLPYCLSNTTPPIAWDLCASCQLHISICTHDVPVEPAYVRQEPGVLQTPVWGRNTSEADYKNFGSARRPQSGISISSLVDDELVAKVKAAKEERDAAAK